MIPRPPAIPASLGALVMLGGLGLLYWSLSGLGLIKPADAATGGGGGVGMPDINPLGGVGNEPYGPPTTVPLGSGGGGGGTIRKG